MSGARDLREPAADDGSDDLRATAIATAEQAAHDADVVLSEVYDHTGARTAAHLFDAVWQRTSGSVLSPESIIAIAHAGGQVTLALRSGEAVGATAAILGRDHDTGRIHIHSHVTGVAHAAAGSGVGRALKWYQRAWCLRRGIEEVRWTFDPLVRRNAVLNLLLLGARAAAYREDAYGPMEDARNAGLPTDRVVAAWDLSSPRVRAAADGHPAAPDIDALRRSGAEPLLVADGDRPRMLASDAPRTLVQVPADIEAIRRTDRALGAAWSDAVRATLGTAMQAGARVSGISRDGWYVVATPTGVTELTSTG